MPANDRHNGFLDEIELGFVEREATPKLLMMLGIQLHLAGLSLSNTVSVLEIFGVERARSTVHN
jgi:transposase-like protein